MRKTLALVLALILCVAAIPACAEELQTLTTFPLSTAGDELTFVVWQHTVHGEFDEMLAWKKYEERTGVHINWIEVPMSNFTEKRNIMLATGDLPDAFYKAQMSMSDITKYAADGLIIPLNDLIETSAPNLKAYYDTHPEIVKALTLEDGKMYSLGYINAHSAQVVTEFTYINQQWLDNLGLKAPTTTDELYDVLKAFKEQDANGNGDPNDEVCIDGYYFGEKGVMPLINALKGSWGLGNRGYVHEYVDMGADGKLRFIPTAEEYRQMLGYIAKLYADGLIDKDVFSSTYEDFLAEATTDRLGMMIAMNAQFAANYAANYKGMEAMKGPNGDKLYTYTQGLLYTPGAFVITSACKNPELAMKWVDYFYSEAGAELLFLVEKGTLYETDENGKNHYLDFITHSPEGRTMGQVLGEWTSWGGGGSPALVLDNYFIGGFVDNESSDTIRPYLPQTMWEAFNYSELDNETLNSLSNDIIGYVKEMTANFITGKASLETDWDAYVQELDKMNLGEYMDIYTRGYERYEGK